MGRKTSAAYISALHQIDVVHRDGAAVAEEDDQDGKPDGGLGGGDGQNEQREHLSHQIAQIGRKRRRS